MQANVEEMSERATLSPKNERQLKRSLAPLFKRNVVSRVVSGGNSYVELSDAIDGAPFRAIVEALLERLIDECLRVTRETQDLSELKHANLASNLLRRALNEVRDRAGRSR